MKFLSLLPLTLFIATLFTPHTEFQLQWFLFGLEFSIDGITKPLSLLTSFVWFIATLYFYFYNKDFQRSFYLFYLLTFIGNSLVVISNDAIGFYLFFSLMSFSAYGLIILDRSKEALRAGALYIKYTVFAEIILFFGIVSLFAQTQTVSLSFIDSEPTLFTTICILIGFGVKAGFFLLHPWLPLTHSRSPVFMSAILSGVMLKTGILGWVKFLPLGVFAFSDVGLVVALFALLGIFMGIYGLFQNGLKEVLAYSSISQMGYLTLIVALMMLSPENYEELLFILLFFAVHHGVAKSTLFLVAGNIKSQGLNPLNFSIAVINWAIIVGLPFTSGAIGKTLIKGELDFAQTPFFLSSFVTALLAIKFFTLALKKREKKIDRAISFTLVPTLFSLTLGFLYLHHYSFALFDFVPLVFAVSFFAILSYFAIKLPLFPTSDIANVFNSVKFKTPKEPKPFNISLPSSFFKPFQLESLLQKQHYSLFVMMSLFVTAFIVLVGVGCC